MNEFFKNLKNEALHIKLSSSEKQRMRVALYETMRVPQPPAQEVITVRAVRSTYVWFSPRFALPVAVVLVMGLGSGTAFAAQGALPGDILYPVKIHVNEPVEVALATTPAEKAVTEENIAGRRVAEAQTLAQQGRLDATTTQELEDNFNEHASRALAFAAEDSSATTSSVDTTLATSATPATTTASTSATEAPPPPQHRVKGERQTPRAGAFFRFASTTPEATTSASEASDASIQNTEGGLSVSFQRQRNIFNELKQRFDGHGRGGDTQDNRNNQNSVQGGDQNSSQNSNQHGDTNDSQGGDRGN